MIERTKAIEIERAVAAEMTLALGGEEAVLEKRALHQIAVCPVSPRHENVDLAPLKPVDDVARGMNEGQPRPCGHRGQPRDESGCQRHGWILMDGNDKGAGAAAGVESGRPSANARELAEPARQTRLQPPRSRRRTPAAARRRGHEQRVGKDLS